VDKGRKTADLTRELSYFEFIPVYPNYSVFGFFRPHKAMNRTHQRRPSSVKFESLEKWTNKKLRAAVSNCRAGPPGCVGAPAEVMAGAISEQARVAC
jgi:hypothetical protein